MDSSDFKTQVLATPTSAASGRVTDEVDFLAARYEVLESLGEGGMGLVYRVRDRETTEVLALKRLRPEIARDPTMIERFKDEIRLARRITHKNVCRIYDFNRVDDLAYITMEYVDGESLRAYLKRVGKLSPERVIDVARQIATGLGEAHAQGVIHRDLKPDNVIIARDGLIKLMDFGIARALESTGATTQVLAGTPGYMAPEQSQGKVIDQRSDIYALGLIMYECLTGRQAFTGATPVEVALKQIKQRPAPLRKFLPSTPPHLEAITMRCLEKEPSRRFASAAELLRALMQPKNEPTRSIPRWRWVAIVLLLTGLSVAAINRATQHGNVPPQTAVPGDAATASADQGQRQAAEELLKLFESAQKGDAIAQERVGRLYLDGPERARDERKALYWTRRAALSGDRNAQTTLARMYESGRGIKQNKIAAYVWYSVAAASGSEPASQELARLKSNFSSDEIAMGEERLRLLREGREE
jgi:predicted Ser/Thr protein kinase